jgi:membrane fusion protein (multidrug efflux system)
MNNHGLPQNGSTEPSRFSELPAAPHTRGPEPGFTSTPETAGPAVSAANPPTFPIKRLRMAGVVAILILAVALFLGLAPRWHQRRVAVADMNQLAIPTVSVVSPTLGKSGNDLTLPAEIRPWREASIYARANGYLKDWVADIGAHVKSGQLLAEIETPDLDQQLAQAKAQLDLSQANLHLAQTTDARWQELLKTASVTEQEAAEKSAGRETAAASVEADRANMRRLEELVGFQRVTAPFDGTITIRSVDIGDLIVAGSGGHELFHIAQTDKLRVYVRVPETYAASIAPGQTATLTTPASPGRSFIARVTTSSEAISTISRTLLVELEVDNSQHQILPYSYGELALDENNSDPHLVLPSNTLLFRAQGLQVAVVRADGTIEMRSVQVGRDFGQIIEVLGGVTPADRVVANPTDSLANGVTVHIASPPATLAAK